VTDGSDAGENGSETGENGSEKDKMAAKKSANNEISQMRENMRKWLAQGRQANT